MLLAAEEKNKVVLLQAPESDAGDEVTLKGVPNAEPFAELGIDDFFKLVLEIDSHGHAVCKNFGKRLKTPVEYVKAEIGAGAKVR